MNQTSVSRVVIVQGAGVEAGLGSLGTEHSSVMLAGTEPSVMRHTNNSGVIRAGFRPHKQSGASRLKRPVALQGYHML